LERVLEEKLIYLFLFTLVFLQDLLIAFDFEVSMLLLAKEFFTFFLHNVCILITGV